MIPKIIWQTHEWEYEDLPYDFKMASLTWKNLNPDWEYRYVSKKDREQYIKDYDQSFVRFYNSCDGISQSDIWRYVVLYVYGGVYVDMDTHACGKLNEVVSTFDESKDFFCMPAFYNDGKKVVVTGTHAATEKSETCNNIIVDICLAKDEKAIGAGWANWIFGDDEEKLNLGWSLISPCILKHEDKIGFNFTEKFVKHTPYGTVFEYIPDLQVFFDNTWYSYDYLSKLNNWDTIP
jgi:hypothetical protein